MAKRTKSKPAAPAPSASSSSNDLSHIREIVQLMAGNDVSYFYSERNGAKLELRRGSDLEAVKELLKSLPASSGAPVTYAAAPVAHAPAPAAAAAAPAAAAPAPAASSAPEAVGPTINSPMVGTFYRSSAPGEKAFANVGDHVDENTTVCIIEAMKVMNEIKPEGVRGTIARVLVEDGKPVQYGQPLFELKA
ncbi:acetyl-CoA carboxylase biotin carboxyl carrier protein [Prosthecobacter vanneervenii]|uniref:Biotin carboxyl carrier protein of acetyl-CoA carboxylase n=1 Tax=Prosthecobacter vanneervenii TaxID=48466 RepID=A0A7W8DJ76_9BACT|nr:acetyl-CoA carboxylase biotin carboxyl carrier protein [Prosthecobacter vanneervenii]MBB5031848.1 acetyl-CoA carboxylase biotin carboxyl carrier protein [Prosthecobacter vanneervenii]